MKFNLIYLLLLLSPYLNNHLFGQELNDFNSTIRQMGLLESQNDAKCHATASRLEDFIYGTPLSFSARNKRIEFQKKYVKSSRIGRERAEGCTRLLQGIPGDN